MKIKMICSIVVGCIGLYDLYQFVEVPTDNDAFLFLVAGIVCLICSANIYYSKDN